MIEQPNVKPTDELLNNQKVPGEVIEQPNVPINTTGSASNEIRTGGVTETGRAPNPINIENVKEDPRYLETASDVRKAIGRHNVIIEKPLGKTIDGIEYKNLNKAIDYSFEKRNIKFDSYNEYNKEHELQELFGQAKQVTRYDPTLDKNTEFIDVYEFRKMKEWNIINKIPAKYFFDFSDVKEISGDKIINIPQTDIDALIKRGIIIKNQIVDSNGTSTFNYTFSHKDKLLQLAKIYKKILSEKDIALGNEMPLITNNGEENIESYIRRITRRVYETNNGTLFATKKDIDFTSYRDHSDGMVIQSERIPVSNNMRTGTILPTNNNYHSTGNYYGPNMRLASRAANILIGRINISTRIFH